MPRQKSNESNTAIEILKGAVAGAVGVWAMDKITSYFTEHDAPSSRVEQGTMRMLETSASPGTIERMMPSRTKIRGKDRSAMLIHRIADAAGYDIEPHQRENLGQGAHYAFGVVPAAIYAATRGGQGTNLGRGLLFGLGSFLLKDEVGSWALGLSERPDAYDWDSHLGGLMGYLGYGAVTEGTLAALDRGGTRAQEAASRAKRRIEQEVKDRRAERESEQPAEHKSERRPPHV